MPGEPVRLGQRQVQVRADVAGASAQVGGEIVDTQVHAIAVADRLPEHGGQFLFGYYLIRHDDAASGVDGADELDRLH